MTQWRAMEADIRMQPVAYVHCTRVDLEDDYWGRSEARIVLEPHLPEESLAGIETFSHAEIVFHLGRVDPDKVVTGARHPRGVQEWPAVGIFAQRAKGRPNRIGSTIVSILGRSGRELRVAELDAVDGTPVLDIKPVLAELLPRGPIRQPAWSHELMRRYWEPEKG